MRSGKMIHLIEIRRATETINNYGTPARSWSLVATLRAEIVRRTTEEFMREQGASTDELMTFRIRHLDGILSSDRVMFEERAFDIREIAPIGWRKGLELRCVAREVEA